MQGTRECGRLLRLALKAIGNSFASPHHLLDESREPDMTEAAEENPTKEESCNQSTWNVQARHHGVFMLIMGECAYKSGWST